MLLMQMAMYGLAVFLLIGLRKWVNRRFLRMVLQFKLMRKIERGLEQKVPLMTI
jgi:hypothetical protein